MNSSDAEKYVEAVTGIDRSEANRYPIFYFLRDNLLDVARAAEALGGKLVSRQVIASTIVQLRLIYKEPDQYE